MDVDEGAEGRRAALAGVYQQVRELLAQDEGAARLELDRQLGLQLEAAQNRIRDLTKRFTDNSQRMRRAREELTGLLNRSQTMAFLQASYELPKVVNFDPYTPRVSLDSEKLAVIQGSASALRAGLVALLAQPLEARVSLLRPEPGPDAAAGGGQDGSTSGPERAVSQPEIAKPAQHRSRAKSPGRPPLQPLLQPVRTPFDLLSQAAWSNQSLSGSSGDPPPSQGPPKNQDKRPPKKNK
ncbi:unnamed protein product [Menidia menidia]|uniref:(Atlantic silverside) hypothetical protein n=1 Tax=Menidia menidia TaxID=238744 RepID=A0A8S4BJ48_9TELE|nr:unnamed protein product [Menidia menidia]